MSRPGRDAWAERYRHVVKLLSSEGSWTSGQLAEALGIKQRAAMMWIHYVKASVVQKARTSGHSYALHRCPVCERGFDE